jgi:hypothetical protein
MSFAISDRPPMFTLTNELHDRGEFVSPFTRTARNLFTSDNRASRLAEAVLLNGQVLALRTASRVPDLCHPDRPFVTLDSTR